MELLNKNVFVQLDFMELFVNLRIYVHKLIIVIIMENVFETKIRQNVNVMMDILMIDVKSVRRPDVPSILPMSQE
jgi:hypothetical protein